MDTKEIELKLRFLNNQDYDKILETNGLLGLVSGSEPEISFFESTYYDTSDRRLNQNRIAFRIRKSGDEYIATVKGSGTNQAGLHIRDEWNASSSDGLPNITPFLDLEIGSKLKEIIAEETLFPLFKTVFKRISQNVSTANGSLIEFSADRGEIISGEKIDPLCEIELELKSGELSDLPELGAILSKQIPLLMEDRSKYLRGLVLAGLANDSDPITAEIEIKNHLSAKLPMISEFRRLFNNGMLEIFCFQNSFLKSPADPETAHQVRVKVRQLRSWLAFLKPLLKFEEVKAVNNDLKVIANQFSAIREFDVLIKAWEDFKQNNQNLLNESDCLKLVLMEERAHAQNRVVDQLSMGKSTALLLRLWSWSLKRQGGAERAITVLTYTKKQLKKRLKIINRLIKDTNYNNLNELHKLRIRFKRIRYVLNDIAPIRSSDLEMVNVLKQRQDSLGEVCDAARNIDLLLALRAKQDDPSVLYEIGILIGVQTAYLENRIKISETLCIRQKFH